ncbi:replication protein A 70 kDa DNA-binding subunit B-like [Telopea speciosissima]|uniref:replication protein A 70 kDa DNA-binding subunit B-like n=1 Tax=Telopea speciosissima TaxID=54955 RepID=UPI001CC6A40F|nr:replication protein A 70 kDa DNA-binding subunit B-like [Telopea speciosissima]
MEFFPPNLHTTTCQTASKKSAIANRLHLLPRPPGIKSPPRSGSVCGLAKLFRRLGASYGEAAPRVWLQGKLSKKGRFSLTLPANAANPAIKGTKIQAVMFNGTVDKFDEILFIGKSYFISNGLVKRVNPNFKSVNTEYELTLNNTSVVEEVEDCMNVTNMIYNFVKLSELKNHSNKDKNLFDVVGIVINVKNLGSIITTKNNDKRNKREIEIINMESDPIMLTVWGEYATNKESKLMDIQSEKLVVAFSSIAVSKYQGFSFCSTGSTIIEINPDISESKELQKWSTIEIEIKKIKQTKSRDTKYTEAEHDKWFYIKGMTTKIENEEPWYNACANCNKKIQSRGNSVTCDKCGKEDVQCRPKYMVRFRVTDSSDTITITIFDDIETVIGCSASEYVESTEKYKNKLHSCVSKIY